MSMPKTLLGALAAMILMAQAQQGQAECILPSFTAAEQETIPTNAINQSVLSTAIVKQTNYYRCQRGMKPLAHDPKLIAAAGIQELCILLELMKHSIIPGNLNLKRPCETSLNLVQENESAEIKNALSSNFAFGGINTVLAVKNEML